MFLLSSASSPVMFRAHRWREHFFLILMDESLPFNSQDLISNSPYCLPHSSCDANLENLVLNQLLIP